MLLLSIAALLGGCASIRGKRAADGFTDKMYMKRHADIPWTEIGRSVENRPIYMTEFGSGEDITLFFSCFHGAERCTPGFGFAFADYLHKNPSALEEGKKVVVIPILNPDGFVRGTRNNANDVDLNRNYPTFNWGKQPAEGRKVFFGPLPASEPETRLVLKLLADVQPDKILSIHQPLECNNNDGPAGLPLAEMMAKYNGYPVEPYIGYPTPGSFGTYAGIERAIPMVTLELPRGGAETEVAAKMWEDNRDALLAVVNCNLEDLQAGK